MQYTHDVVSNCTLEIYIILLVKVTSRNLIKTPFPRTHSKYVLEHGLSGGYLRSGRNSGFIIWKKIIMELTPSFPSRV